MGSAQLGQAADGTWTSTAGGNWTDTTKWFGGTIADGTDFTANFTSDITATTAVSLNAVNRTIGNLIFSDNGAAGSAWTITGNTLTLAGSSTPTITTTTDATISSIVAGTQGLTKEGAGILTLGSTANTYTGTTTINNGTIKTGGTSGNRYIVGDIVINNGGTLDLGGSATVGQNYNQLGQPGSAGSPTNTVTVNSGGNLTWLNTVQTFNNLTLNSKTLTLNGGHSAAWGSLVILNTLTATGTSAINVGTGSNNFISPSNAGPKTLNVAVPNSGDSLTIAPVIQNYDSTNTYALTKTGAGTLTLKGQNTYTGATTVSGGTLIVDESAGATSSMTSPAFVINGASTLLFTATNGAGGRNDMTGKTWTFDSAGGGTINSTVGNWLMTGTVTTNGGARNTITGSNINLNSGAFTFNVAPGTDGVSDLNVTNALGNSTLGITKIGNGTLTFNGSAASTYTGVTSVNGGTFRLDFANMVTPTNLLATTSTLTLGGGTFNVLGKSTGTTSQTLGNPSFTGGTSNIVLSPNGGTSTNLTLGNTWSVGTGATLIVDLSAGTSTTATLTSSPTLTGGIINPGVFVKDATGTSLGTVVSGQVVRVASTVLDSANSSAGTTTTNFTTSPSDPAYSSGTLILSANLHGANSLVIDSTGGGTLDLNFNTLTLAANSMLMTGSGNYTIQSGNVGGSGSAVTIHQAGTGTLTISSPISGGAGSLTKAGSGTLVLMGSNNYSGNTTIGGGTLTLGLGGVINNSAATVLVAGSSNSSNTLNVGSGASITAANLNIQQQTGVTNYTGNYNQTGGTVSVGTTFELGSSTTGSGSGNVNNATISGGTLTTPFASLYKWATSNVTVSNTGTLNATSFRIGWVDASPTGSITLGDGANFTGGTSINDGGTSGVLNVGSWSIQTNRNYTLNLNGGTLKASAAGASWLPAASFTTAAVKEAGGIIDNSGLAITIGQVFSHGGVPAIDGGLVFKGSGTTTLAGVNTYTGTTTINAGTIKTGGTVGTKYIAGDIVINNGGTLDLGGSATVGQNYNQLGQPGTSNPTNTVTVNNGGNLTWLNTVQTFNNLTLNSKTLTLNGGHSAPWGSLVVFNTLTATGTSAINVGTGSNNSISPGSAGAKTLNVAVTNSGDSLTIAPVIQNYDATNTYALAKSGAGTLTLTAANTYTAGTTVNAGTLTIGATGSIAAGGMTVTGASSVLNINGSYTNTAGSVGVSVTGGGTINLSGTATLGGSNSAAVLIGNAGVGTVNMTGGTLTSNYSSSTGWGIGWGTGGNGTVNVSGGTFTNGNANVFYVGSGAGATGALNVSSNGVVNTGIFNVGVGNTTAVGNVSVSGNGILNIGTGGTQVFIGGGTSGGNNYGTGTLTVSGNGQVTVAAGGSFPSDYVYLAGYGGSGTITLNGGTLTTSRTILTGSGTNTAFNFNGGTLQAGASKVILGPVGSQIAAAGTSNSFINQARIQAGGATFDSNTYTANVTQHLLAAGGGVTKIGAGTIIFDGNNTYTGGTTISEGTLKVSKTLAASTGVVNIAAAGTLDLSGTTQTTGAVTLSGGTISNGLLNASNIAATGGSISTALTGSGSLTKTGAGTLTVTGASTYTGGTTLSGGTLVVGGSSTSGANLPAGFKIAAVGDSITQGSGLPTPATQAWPAVLQSLIQSRMGNTNVTVSNFGNSGSTAIFQLGNIGPAHPYTGTSTYTSALASNPNAVVIQLGTNDSIATAAQIQQYYASDLTTIINAFKATPNNPAIYLALPPAIYTNSGNQDETKLTTYILPLIQQVATATGATVIDNHTLTLNESTLYPDALHPGVQGESLLGTSVFSTLASTYFQNGPLGAGTVTLNGGTLSDDGTARTLYNSLAITGNVTFASTGSGSLTFDPASLGSTVTISNTPTLTVSNTTTIKQVVSGTGFAKDGNGTLTLTAANTYTGITTVNAGQLTVTGSIANNGPLSVLVAAPDDTAAGNPILSRRVLASASYTLGSATGQGSTAVSIDPITASALNTTASIMAGTASVQTDVTMQWRTRTIAEGNGMNHNAVLSDVVNLNGTGSDVFLLEMSYNDAALAVTGVNETAIALSGELRLGWLDGSNWISAVNGNTGGGNDIHFEGTISSTTFLTNLGANPLSSKLGSYGVDPSTNTVWAVLNHNSDFAVIPEPSTLVAGSVMALGLVLAARRRRRV